MVEYKNELRALNFSFKLFQVITKNILNTLLSSKLIINRVKTRYF